MVGKIFGFSKTNVYNRIKKKAQLQEHKEIQEEPKHNFAVLELDELYWFIKEKARSKTHENIYVITMVSRQPRQIVGFDAEFDK